MKESHGAERQEKWVCSVFMFVFHPGRNRTTCWDRLGVILIGDVGGSVLLFQGEGEVDLLLSRSRGLELH